MHSRSSLTPLLSTVRRAIGQEDKRYVQHLIDEDSAAIYRKLVLEQGSFYISGSVTLSLLPPLAGQAETDPSVSRCPRRNSSSNAMPRAVKKAVVRAFMKEHVGEGSEGKGVSEDVALAMVERMEDEGRWSEECWS